MVVLKSWSLSVSLFNILAREAEDIIVHDMA